MKKVPILLILSIFGITTQAWADSDKSMNNASNQIKTMKLDENNGILQKKKISGKDLLKMTTKQKAGFQSVVSFSNDGGIPGNSESDVTFLTTLEQEKRSRWVESLAQAISSYEFSQNDWRNEFLNLQKVSEIKASHRDFDLFASRPYPTRNIHFEEEGILRTLKLLQSKRDAIFKEIFMGFRFSFKPMSGHIFLEMTVTPSPEEGPEVIIPF